MEKIYKYPLELTGYQVLKLPMGAQILTVQTQNGKPFLWALVNTKKEETDFEIEILGTGDQITGTNERKYISTFQLNGGEFVFHVFQYLGL